MFDLGVKNKKVLVTGGTHGIGRAIAIAFAKQGCEVAVCSRTEERVSETIDILDSVGVRNYGGCVDALNKNEIDNFCGKLKSEFGAVDILINNVGGGGRWGKEAIEETSIQVWKEVLEKNLFAALNFTLNLLPSMRENKWGRVITISSLVGRECLGRPWYNIAKGSEIQLMKSMACNPQIAKDGITFNTIAPGSIMIPNTGWEDEAKNNTKVYQEKVNSLPMGRLGTPEEVASVALFLGSIQSSLVSGACIPVDGSEGKAY